MVRPNENRNVFFSPSVFAEATFGIYTRQEIGTKLKALATDLKEGKRKELIYAARFFDAEHIFYKREEQKYVIKKKKSITLKDLENVLLHGGSGRRSQQTKQQKMRTTALLDETAFSYETAVDHSKPTISVQDVYSASIRTRHNPAYGVGSGKYRAITIRGVHLSENGEISEGLESLCQCEHATKNFAKDPTREGKQVTTNIVCYHTAVALMVLYAEHGNAQGERRINIPFHLADAKSLLPFKFDDFGLVLETVLRRYWKGEPHFSTDTFLMDQYQNSILTDQAAGFIRAGKATLECIRSRDNFARQVPEDSVPNPAAMKEAMIRYIMRYKEFSQIGKKHDFTFRGFARDFIGTPWESISHVFVDKKDPAVRVHIAYNSNYKTPLFLFLEDTKEGMLPPVLYVSDKTWDELEKGTENTGKILDYSRQAQAVARIFSPREYFHKRIWEVALRDKGS